MKNKFLDSAAGFLFCLLLSSVAHGQQVANYSVGKMGTKEYEHLEFWTQADSRDKVLYSYGTPEKELTLTYLGKDTCQGAPCFKVRLPNHIILSVVAQGSALKVTDKAGKYAKVFRWQYEGPINGIGTFCDVCAEDEDAAMELVKEYFLK